MNNHLIYLTAITATIFILVSSTAQAADISVDTSPFCPANTPTDRYIINTNVTFNCTAPVYIYVNEGYSAIFVNNFYTLDMNGTVLIGNSSGIGIELGSNSILKNGIIRNYSTAVLLVNSSNNTVSNNTLSNNDVAIYFDSGFNHIIIKNMINNNTYAIYFSSTSNATISNNTISTNGYGIYFYSGSNNIITKNMVNDNNNGIYLFSTSNNTLSNNTVNNNDYGIYFSNSTNNMLISNILNNNKNTAIYLESSPFSTLTANNMTGNAYNLWAYDQYMATQNISDTNLAEGKPIYWLNGTSDAIYSDVGLFVCLNCNNVTVTNSSITRAYYGVYFTNTSNSYITNINVSNSDTAIYFASGSDNTITNNIVNNNQYGLYLESISNNILSNNTASDNSYTGIYLASGSNNTITNNVVNNNNEGIFLYSISNTIVSNNTVNNNTGIEMGIGISVDSSSSNTITNNMVHNNSYAILFHNTSNTIVSNNTVSNNTYAAIYLDSGSNNTITNNIFNNNYYAIFTFVDGPNNTITNNTVNNNIYGISLTSNFNIITNNTASNNTYGITLSSANNSILLSNIVNNNNYAIYTINSLNNSFINNIANNNNYSIYLSNTSNNTISNNTANNNSYGIYFFNSINNTLITNTILNSLESDFYVEDIDSTNNNIYNTTLNNSIISFTGMGILLKSSYPIASAPAGYRSLGKHVNITNLSDAGSWIFLNITYSGTDVIGMNESKLSIWRYNSTAWNNWTGVNGVNTAGKYVYANLTNFSIFDVFGLDDIAPSITISSPISTTYSSSSVALSVSANEPVSSWWYSLDGGPNRTFTPNTTLSGLSNAQHMLVVYANDTVGNINSAIIYFVVLVPSQPPSEEGFIFPGNISLPGNATNITNVTENITTNITNITSITNITNVTENITTNVTNITSIINISNIIVTTVIEESRNIFSSIGSIYIDVINKTSENIKQILSTIFRPPKYVCGNNICEEDEDTLVCPADCPQKITLIHLAMIAALITTLAAIGWAIKMRRVKRKKLLKILKTKR